MAQLKHEITINATPETVFGLLTNTEKLTTWLADIVGADAQPGGVFYISNGADITIRGEFIEVIPYEKVVFSWGGVEGLEIGQSIVEFTLIPNANGTLLQLRHYELPEDALNAHRQRWQNSALPVLQNTAEGNPPTIRCLPKQ